MKDQDVMISIKGIQGTGPHDEPEQIELVTCGKYSHAGEETVFSYMESEMTGLGKTKTTFRVGPKAVTLTREGALNAQMVFETGRKHIFLYETPYGASSMGVDTRRLEHGLGETGGKMEIDYTIDLDSAVVSENSFIISVSQPGKGMGANPEAPLDPARGN